MKNITQRDSLEKFVEAAKVGDVDLILFSPGSSSYDQFNNYEERGNFFKSKMQELYELIL